MNSGQRTAMAVAAKRPRDGSDGDADARKRQKGAEAIDFTEEASPQEKKMRASINDVAADLLCPITQELPLEPVIAKDGKIYERNAILEWFSKKDGDATSPSTGKVIDTELVPAVQVRNTIESLIKSGAIEGELAEAWKEKLEQEKVVKEWRAKAEGGDGYAMLRLGARYAGEDDVQSRAWFELSAAERDPKGMAMFSSHLLRGIGGPQDNVFGVMNVTQAAELGSEYGAYLLGKAFMTGFWGLPKDPARARFWLRKVADDECAHKQLTDLARADAVECLRALKE